ncbi:hypothetical protein QYF36_009668 [Acer negundo]|nr:hypothetical protein QYF36_009668 [Acer negundo]
MVFGCWEGEEGGDGGLWNQRWKSLQNDEKPYRHQPPPSTSTHRQIDLPLCRQLPPPSAKPRPLPPKEKEKRRSTAGRDVSGDG